MAGIIRDVRRLNSLGEHALAEPFAGGAGASLQLLFDEDTSAIFINDADPSINDFWWAAVSRSTALLALLKSTRVSMPEWRRQRATYTSTRRVARVRRGFSAFYLNRCNRSGIIASGGPIGGVKQGGKWRLDARYNKVDLAGRLQRIAEYSDRIRVSGLDGLEFINTLDLAKTMLFVDPPYYAKGGTLYLNGLNHEYHARLSTCLRENEARAWMLTYDDCPEIRSLYARWANIRSFGLRYAANERRSGREVLITPRWMKLPHTQRSAAISW